jgi:hypothetical protein
MPGLKDPKTITAYAGLIASVTAMVVSIAALNKKPEEQKAQSMYKVLVEAIERLSDESEQNRLDLVRLRKYIDEYHKATDANGDSSAGPPPIAPPAPVVEVKPPRSTSKSPIKQFPLSGGGGVATSSSASIVADSTAMPAPAPLSKKPVELNREWETQ